MVNRPMLVLVAAAILLLGGSVLLAHYFGDRRHRLGRRLALVAPPPPLTLQRVAHVVRRSGCAEQETEEIVRLLGAIGVPLERAFLAFAVLRLAIAAAIGGLVYLAVPIGPPLLLLGLSAGVAIVGWLAPIWLVRLLVRRHSEAAAEGLPDALELLVICVEAGLSLEDALERVVRELHGSQPALAGQLAITAADLKILPSRDQALANLAARVDRPAIRSVVTTLSQTMRYGTPLAQAMRVVAAEMRNEALIALEEKANRLPVLMTVPLMLFIMPTVFLLVGGPAALHLIDTFLR